MNKKSKPRSTETKPERDLAMFEELPEESQELMRLKDEAEKTVGPKKVVITRKIAKKARKPRP